MSDVRTPFARRIADDTIVGVERVVSGLACECVCPECGLRVLAVKGEVYRHHFRHAVESACGGGRETALHLFAKQTICHEVHVSLPDSNLRMGKMLSAQIEVWMDGIRPDVLADYASEQVAIEIFVAHRVPREKLEKIQARELTTVEIDLSYYRDADLTESALRHAVLFEAPRRWIYDPLHIRQKRQAMLAAMREAERIALLAAEQAAREAEAARIAAAAEQAARWEIQRQVEAEQRAKVAARAVEQAAARRAEEARLETERERQEVLRREREAERHGPDLQKLVAAYGTYSAIPFAAWARYHKDMELWLAKVRHGDFWYEK